jgi:hypothetical protein
LATASSWSSLSAIRSSCSFSPLKPAATRPLPLLERKSLLDELVPRDRAEVGAVIFMASAR